VHGNIPVGDYNNGVSLAASLAFSKKYQVGDGKKSEHKSGKPSIIASNQ